MSHTINATRCAYWPKQIGKGPKIRKTRKDRGVKITDASFETEIERCHACQRPSQMIAIGLKDLIQSHDTNIDDNGFVWQNLTGNRAVAIHYLTWHSYAHIGFVSASLWFLLWPIYGVMKSFPNPASQPYPINSWNSALDRNCISRFRPCFHFESRISKPNKAKSCIPPSLLGTRPSLSLVI